MTTLNYQEKGIKILLIEDSYTDAYIFKENLKKSSIEIYSIEIASTVKKSIEFLEAPSDKQFDIIFLDYRLPDMDGLGFLKEIQKFSERPPIVMLSGQGSEDVAVQALKDGAQNYITKDRISPSDLKKMITSTIEEYTAKKKNEKDNLTARKLAVHDPLTGLFNRRHFDQLIQNEFKKAKRFNLNLSLIFLDLDHFKEVNDCCGHATGDLVLKSFAEILVNTARDIDFLCRTGGEEFIILLPNTDEASAINLSTRLKDSLQNQPIEHNGQKLIIRCCQGISSISDTSIKNPQDLIELADKAMYTAKAQGRNSICTSSMNVRLQSATFDANRIISFKNSVQGKRKKIKEYYRNLILEIFEELTNEQTLLEKHHREVAGYAKKMAIKYKLEENSVLEIYNAALLHDIGLLGVTTETLKEYPSKDNALNISQLTVELLSNYKILDHEIPIIIHQNENFDGSGQPYQLQGKKIPIGSRILALADTYATLVHPPFEKMQTLPWEKALDEMKKLSGSRLDPELVRIFEEIIKNR